MENYYKTLGIEENASQEEIKRAYRSLASKHHPDKGGDTATFQKIQEAYSTLSDEKKKNEYDFVRSNPTHEFRFRTNDFTGNPFEEFFGFQPEDFFRQRTQIRKNRNIKINIGINLHETLDNIEKFIQVKSGNELKNVKIDIPRGVRSNSAFKYSGLGDTSIPHLPPGDLLVEVIVVPDDRFQISGTDLITTLAVDCFDAITGATVKVQGLDNKELEFNINAGTSNGAKYKLKGQGLYLPNSLARGDLFVIINLTVKKYDSKDIELIKQIKSQLNENR